MSDDARVRAALERNRDRLAHAAEAVGFPVPPDLDAEWFSQLLATVLRQRDHAENAGIAEASRTILELPAATNQNGISTPLGLISVVEREMLRLRANKRTS